MVGRSKLLLDLLVLLTMGMGILSLATAHAKSVSAIAASHLNLIRGVSVEATVPAPAVKSCTGSGPGGTAIPGGDDTCTITTTVEIPASGSLLLLPTAPAGAEISQCRATPALSMSALKLGNLACIFYNPGPIVAPADGSRSAAQLAIPAGTVIGSERFTIPGGALIGALVTQDGLVCAPMPVIGPRCPAGAILSHGPIPVSGSGAVVGGAVPSTSPSPFPSPSASSSPTPSIVPAEKFCAGPPPDLHALPGGSNTCAIVTGVSVPPNGYLAVTLVAPAGSKITTCVATPGLQLGVTISESRMTCTFSNPGPLLSPNGASNINPNELPGWRPLPPGTLIGSETFTIPADAEPGTAVAQTGIVCGPLPVIPSTCPASATVAAGEISVAGPGAIVSGPTISPTPSPSGSPSPSPSASPSSRPQPCSICRVAVQPAATEAPRGSRATVSLTANAPPGGLGAWGINVIYDPLVLVPLPGGCNSTVGSSCNLLDRVNTIRVTGASAAGLTGNLDLAEISFAVVGTQGSSSTLGLRVTTFADAAGAQFSAATANGTVLVRGLLGDVDGDGAVNPVDALCILRAVAAMRATPACPAIPLIAPSPGDVNGDGTVDAVDALCILRSTAGLQATARCPLPPNDASLARNVIAAESQSRWSNHAIVPATEPITA